MIIYIIRHGETRLNKLGCLQGHVDEPLNEKGIELAEITGKALREVPFDLMITSPLCRARKTGELVIGPSEEYYGRKIPVVEDRRLMEIDWGAWDMLGCSEQNYELPEEQFNLLYSDSFAFKGAEDGEDLSQVRDRTQECLRDVVDNPEYQDKIILLSTHGLAMRAMLNQFYEDKNDFWQTHVPYNCEMNVLGAKDGKVWMIAKDQIFYDKSLCLDRYRSVVANRKKA